MKNKVNHQLKILHIITSLGNGGAEGALYKLCKYEADFDHIVISLMDDGKYGRILKGLGVQVYCLNFPKGKVRLMGIVKLVKLLRSIRPNVVQTWMYHADFLGGIISRLFCKCKVFWGVRHSDVEDGAVGSSTKYILKICAWLSYSIPEKIISCSCRGVDVHVLKGYQKDKFIIIPNGYDLIKFNKNRMLRNDFRRELDLSDEIFVFGMVGRYNKQKDHLNLLTSLKKIRDQGYNFILILVGPKINSTNKELVEKIRYLSLEDHVILLGERIDIPKIMNGIDTHVLSSASGEGFPNVIAEAMACGTPCIATDVGDAQVIIDDCGWIVKPKQADEMAIAMMEAINLYNNKKHWKSLGLSCRRRIVENYSIDCNVNAYKKAWVWS